MKKLHLSATAEAEDWDPGVFWFEVFHCDFLPPSWVTDVEKKQSGCREVHAWTARPSLVLFCQITKKSLKSSAQESCRGKADRNTGAGPHVGPPWLSLGL